MATEYLKEELYQLEIETFEIEEFLETNVNTLDAVNPVTPVAAGSTSTSACNTSSSCSCSSCSSCSTSSCCSCSTSSSNS